MVLKRYTTLLVVLGVLVAAGVQAAGVVKNGEFVVRAAGNDNWPADWSAAADTMPAYAAVNDDGCSDQHSLHYTALAGRKVGAVTQGVTLQKNTDYVLMAALKSDGTLRPVVRLMGPQGQLAMVVSDGSKTWKTFTARFNSGAAASGTVEIFGDAGLTTVGALPEGKAAIDGVQICLPAELPKAAASEAPFVAPGPNVALHRPYTFSPGANYGLASNDPTHTLLTDGAYTVGYFWTQKTTVGWSGANPVIITLDLGKVEPIAGMAYDTAAGVAGVAWPNGIMIMVSDDGKTWSSAGDLMTLATKKTAPPPATPYQVHKFATDALKTHGRYVKLYVDQTPYAFVDEIEVYQGPQELLQAPLGPIVDDPLKLFNSRLAYSGMIWRLRTDVRAARTAIQDAKLPEAQRQQLLAKADQLAAAAEALPTDMPADFKTILPFNDVHAAIYALYAPLARARGLAPLTVWSNSRWDMLAPTEAPAKPAPTPTVNVQMMQREYRGATFNLTNTTDAPLRVRLNISGLPGGVNPSYVSVREVPFTDTRDRVPIADALPESKAGAEGYRISIPAGMTRQVWLDFRPLDVKPGDYKGEISLRPTSGAAEAKVPLAFHLSPVAFPALPSIHVGGWDYTDTAGTYEVDPGNMAQFLQVLPANYVDTPWAGGSTQPTGGKFDPEGKATAEFDFTRWDSWLAKWPGARQYAVFLSVPDNFYGEKMGTLRFNNMIAAWINAWVAHMQTQKLEPEQLILLLVDEPHESNPAQTQIIKTWAQAINAAQPRVTLFEDPTYAKPQDVKDGFWNEVDVLCPNLPMFLAGDQAYRNFYLAQQQAGKQMWFYSCSGPSKLLDPITYHRSQFWWAARYGFKGSFYWAFGDEGGGSSWNAYLQKRAQYSPLFLDATSVTDAKHMAAIREGAQDYEYFVMLRDRIAQLEQKGVRGGALEQAKQLAEQGPASVCEQITDKNLSWSTPKDREMMDRVRVQVLTMLEKLAKL